MSKQQQVAVAASEPQPSAAPLTLPAAAVVQRATPADPNAGRGGSYVLDPSTGVRTLVQRTRAAGCCG